MALGVEVTGRGPTLEDAVKDALRQGKEKLAGDGIEWFYEVKVLDWSYQSHGITGGSTFVVKARVWIPPQ